MTTSNTLKTSHDSTRQIPVSSNADNKPMIVKIDNLIGICHTRLKLFFGLGIFCL